MAGYASVVPNDPNYVILSLLDKTVKRYVVTYLNSITGLRVIYGMYQSARRAVKACSGVSGFSPVCFLVNVAGQFFVTHDGRTLPH